MIVLIGGGSRSGKSRYALEYATRLDGPRAFIATAQALDDEMRSRIAAHREQRRTGFTTFEEPLDLASVLARDARHFATVVVDCLTLWVSNLMLSGRDVSQHASQFLRCCTEVPATVILVANEVGCGIVPDNELARRFRDLAGNVNQQAAAAAAEAWWMAFGIPLRLK